MKMYTASQKFVRGSARKARIPAEIVKGKQVDEAIAILEYTPKKAAKDVQKAIKSARANAEHNFGRDPQNLVVAHVQVDQAKKVRRFKAGSRGMANVFHKHYCHIDVTLGDMTEFMDTFQSAQEEVETAQQETHKKIASTSKEVVEAKNDTKAVSEKKSAKAKKSTKKADSRTPTSKKKAVESTKTARPKKKAE